MFNWSEAHHMVDERVSQMDSLLRLRCVLRNLPQLCRQSGLVVNPVPYGTPALLCSYGASLMSQIEKLKDCSSRVLLIATARAAAAMIDEGVFPKVVVAEEPWANHFWQVPVRLDHSWLVAVPEVDPAIPASFGNTTWMCSEHAEVNGLLKALDIELPKHAVQKRLPELLLLEVAVKLGCGKVGLVGYDYCLDAYGRFFPEQERPENEEAFETPGIDGRSVLSVDQMNQNRSVLQDGISGLSKGHGDAMPVLVNCARRGARIEGTVSQTLNDFFDGAEAHVSRYPLFVKAEDAPVENSSGVLLEILARLRQVVGSFVVAARQENATLDALRHEIQNMMGSGKVVLVETARFLQIIVDSLHDDEYAVMCRFGHMLSQEIAGDMDEAVSTLFKSTDDASVKRDVHVFNSLKGLGCDLIARNNPVLAEHLLKMDSRLPSELQVNWSGQSYPGIEYMVHNEYIPVTDRVNQCVRTELDVDRFVERNQFDPDGNALVILGACDWMHVHAFVRRFEKLKLLIVEPWIELLNVQLEHADIISALPRDTLVVGMGKRIDSWAIQYSQRTNLWRAEGRVVVFFIPPALRKLKTIRACYETLTEKI